MGYWVDGTCIKSVAELDLKIKEVLDYGGQSYAKL